MVVEFRRLETPSTKGIILVTWTYLGDSNRSPTQSSPVPVPVPRPRWYLARRTVSCVFLSSGPRPVPSSLPLSLSLSDCGLLVIHFRPAVVIPFLFPISLVSSSPIFCNPFSPVSLPAHTHCCSFNSRITPHTQRLYILSFFLIFKHTKSQQTDKQDKMSPVAAGRSEKESNLARLLGSGMSFYCLQMTDDVCSVTLFGENMLLISWDVM